MEFMKFDTILSANQLAKNIESNISNESFYDKHDKAYYELAGSVNYCSFKLHEPNPFFMRRYNRVEITGRIIDLGTLRKVIIKISINYIGTILLYIISGTFIIGTVNSNNKLFTKLIISAGCFLLITIITVISIKRAKKDYQYYKSLLFRWILQ